MAIKNSPTPLITETTYRRVLIKSFGEELAAICQLLEADRMDAIARIHNLLGDSPATVHEMKPTGPGVDAAEELAKHKRFGHWFIEFWDVVDTGGFDLIIGNPPYLGGQALSGSYGHAFCEWVKWEYAPVGLSDLVIFFLRRIYDLLRPSGFAALITTNSIKDGDNRRDGLDWLVAKGGVINMAVRGMKWPGQAKVVVSLLTIHRGPWSGKYALDGKEVPIINSFFEDSQNVGEPVKLVENEDQIFQGVIFLGDGFLLTTAEAERICHTDPRCREVIFSVINGQELNNQPDQSSERKIINFFDWPLSKASGFGEAFERIQDVVKPVRDTDNRALYRERWWQYGEPRRKLTANLLKLKHCFGTSRVTKYLNFSACSADLVFSNNVYVFTTERWDKYAIVQSTLHEVWARKYSMSLKQDLQYSPTDCFHTFAFPCDLAHQAALAAIGETYHEHRRALMRALWLGLTDLYNLFHDPDLTPALVTESLGDRATIPGDEGFTSLLRLRDLHRELDQTVLTAYGWHTASDFGPPLTLGHNFHSVEFLPENDRTRYTIHPDARRELLTRLLKLNHARAEQAEQLAKQAAIAAPIKKKKIKPAKPIELAPRKHSKGINFTRGAIASYAVNRLGDRWQFGRIQMEKVLYLAQQEVGINLEMEFQHGLNGPFDEEIHKLESLAAKEGWFLSVPRAGDKGTSYQRGSKIADRCGAAATILGKAKAKFDSILDWLAKMDTERAEIWATVHAVWNELLLAKQPVSDDGIIQGVYAWHPAKTRFAPDRIAACIGWMRKEGFVPRGITFETREKKPVEAELDLGLDLFGRQADAPATTKPQVASFASAYPSNSTDKLICALGLEIVEWRKNISSDDHLDALILATHPELCRIFTGSENALQLDSWSASIEGELKAIATKGLKWLQCLTYLEDHRHALIVVRSQPDRTIRAGKDFEAARQSFTKQHSAMVAHALGILDSLRERRTSRKLSPEQTKALKNMEELHTQYALA